MNTGKLCIFTDTGKMHQVKVLDLPYGKFREKGTPIDNVSNYTSSEEEIVMICDAEQMRFAKLLFATAQGMIKRVDGKEFQVSASNSYIRLQSVRSWQRNFRKMTGWFL